MMISSSFVISICSCVAVVVAFLSLGGLRDTLSLSTTLKAADVATDESGYNKTDEEQQSSIYVPHPHQQLLFDNTTIDTIFQSTCRSEMKLRNEMKYLCSGHFVQTATDLLLRGEHVNIVQIGAHVGFEDNDPIAHGLSTFLDKIAKVTNTEQWRKQFHWTFVEPSPATYKGLEQNLANLQHSKICDMRSVNAAVISDLADDQGGNMVFYGMSDTINPVSGYDSKSGKVLPNWLTQISSLSREQVFKPMFIKAFRHFGLDINDYVVATNVTTMSYTNLMKKVLVAPNNNQSPGEPLLVLVDTEGFDCNVVEGISEQSPYLPKYLVYEHIHCNNTAAENHLHEMGYFTSKVSENVLAIHLASSEYWPVDLG